MDSVLIRSFYFWEGKGRKKEKNEKKEENWMEKEITEEPQKTLPSNMAAKTSFCLDLVKRLMVTLRCAVNVPTSTFQHSP